MFFRRRWTGATGLGPGPRRHHCLLLAAPRTHSLSSPLRDAPARTARPSFPVWRRGERGADSPRDGGGGAPGPARGPSGLGFGQPGREARGTSLGKGDRGADGCAPFACAGLTQEERRDPRGLTSPVPRRDVSASRRHPRSRPSTHTHPSLAGSRRSPSPGPQKAWEGRGQDRSPGRATSSLTLAPGSVSTEGRAWEDEARGRSGSHLAPSEGQTLARPRI